MSLTSRSRVMTLLALAAALAVAATLLAVVPARAFPLPLPTALTGPPGANDWSCEPTLERPTPVVLVHGTFGDRTHLLEQLSRQISGAGYCVFSLDYGNRATGDIRKSAQQLKDYVQRVRRATGAERVSLVGHSQGGMMPRYYITFLGGAEHVEDLVGIAPSNHGTELLGAFTALAGVTGPVLDLSCRACAQQAAGSDFLRRLNRGDETPGPVSYTQITTRYDEVVVPHTSGYLAEGPRTTNLTIQDVCPAVVTEHLAVPTHPVTIQVTLHALDRRGPAREDFQPSC